MTLKIELTDIVKSQGLTALIKALAVNQPFNYRKHADFYPQINAAKPPFIASTLFKDSAFLFTHSGAYADMATVLTLIDEVATLPIQP